MYYRASELCYCSSKAAVSDRLFGTIFIEPAAVLIQARIPFPDPLIDF